MGEQWMNDYLVKYVENNIFKTITNKEIIQ